MRPKRKLDDGVVKVTRRDKNYFEVQSAADEVKYAKSFIVDQALQGAVAGTILFSQSISARSLATAQQHATTVGADAMLTTYLQNYLDYSVASCEVKLDTTTPEMVSGVLAVMFCPETLIVNASNFVQIIESRTVAGRIYPGTYLVPLDKLRTRKNMTFPGFFKGGARPINSPVGSDPYKSIVGKVVVGVFTSCLVAEIATSVPNQASTSSSTSGSTVYVGPLAKLSMHADLRFIFSAPGQIPPEGQVYSVQMPIQFSGRTTRVDPPGMGDFNVDLLTGPTPVALAQLENSTEPYTSGPIGVYPEFMTLPGRTSDDDTTSVFLSTTVREIAEVAIEGVSEFFPPGIKQLISFGGRTLLGVMSRIVGNQDTMLAKTKNMQLSNNIVNNDDVSTTAEPSLTPATSLFTPGASSYNGIPLGRAPQLFINACAAAPVGSVAHTFATLTIWCLVRGIYPFFMTSYYNSGYVDWAINSTQEVFLKNNGGTPQLIPTIVSSGTLESDEYAGLPLIVQSQMLGIGPWCTKYVGGRSPQVPIMRIGGYELASPLGRKALALWPVPVLDFSERADVDGLSDSVLYGANMLPTIDEARQRISAFFGVEPVTIASPPSLSFSIRLSYALFLVRYGVDDHSIFTARSPRSSDNGLVVINITMPFGQLVDLDFYSGMAVSCVEMVSRSGTMDAYGTYPIRPFEHLLDTGYDHLYSVAFEQAPLA